MSGTKAGGLKAAATNKKRHGEGFYARIGAKGGRNGHSSQGLPERLAAKSQREDQQYDEMGGLFKLVFSWFRLGVNHCSAYGF